MKSDIESDKKGDSLWGNIRYMMRNLVKYDKILIFLLFFGACTMTSMWYLWTFITRYVIALIEKSSGNSTTDFHRLLMMFFTVFFLQAVLMACNVVSESYLSYHMTYVRLKMNQERVAKTLAMDYEQLETPTVIDLMKKAEKSLEGGQVGVNGMLLRMQRFLQMSACLIVGMAIIFTLNPWLVVAAVFIGILQGLHYGYTVKIEKKLTWDQTGPILRKQNYLNEIAGDFSYAKDIRLFFMKKKLLDRQKAVNKEQLELNKQAKDQWIKDAFVSGSLRLLLGVVLYGYVVKAVLYDGMSIANFSFYVISAFSFTTNVTNMFNSFSKFKSCADQVNDLRAFMDLKNRSQGGEVLTVPKEYEIRFEHVCFTYPETEIPVIQDLNLTLRSGERLAVVGLNGAGKTTFIKLLLRIYDVTSGSILLNGKDIRTYSLESYYAMFAPVFQNVELFAFPLSENISMTDEEQTDRERVLTALQKAGLMDKVDRLPNGLDTNLLKILHEDGIDLSGGERQKLALARALYKNAPFIVLDEPTSAMDAISESKLYQDFDKLVEGKTAVYISHRLSSTRFCEAVAMFEDGRLTEYGTHESLMEKKGAYANMYEVQSKYYKEDYEGEGGLDYEEIITEG